MIIDVQVTDNVEVNALIKILGLQYKMKYEKDDDMKSLRYGKVMVMADQVGFFLGFGVFIALIYN